MNAQPLVIAGIFIAYFIIHSLTASLWLKGIVARYCPRLSPFYRLLFNLLATLLALPLVYLAWRYPGEPLWQWEGEALYLANALALAAGIALLYALRIYDMGDFLGLSQARQRKGAAAEGEPFQLSAFHRYVRHPWYALILVIIWTRDMHTNQLLIYALVTAYLIVGSRLEERKLLHFYGDVYAEYRRRVAGLVPLPWKTLSRDEAEALLARHRRKR
ncbi:MAG: methyltransferase family protein [Pseudomonadota bacterium]